MEAHHDRELLAQVRACPEFIPSPRSTSRRDAIGLKHYSYRAERTYVGWIKRYIAVRGVRRPSETDSTPGA